MQKHILTKEQAERIGLNPKDEVEVILYTKKELKKAGLSGLYAKSVYFNGKRVGGILDINLDGLNE